MSSSNDPVRYCSAYSGSRPPPGSYGSDKHHSDGWEPRDLDENPYRKQVTIDHQTFSRQTAATSNGRPHPDSATSRRDQKTTKPRPPSPARSDVTDASSRFELLPPAPGTRLCYVEPVTLKIRDDETRHAPKELLSDWVYGAEKATRRPPTKSDIPARSAYSTAASRR